MIDNDCNDCNDVMIVKSHTIFIVEKVDGAGASL